MPRSSGRRRSAGAESGGGNGEDSSARNGRRRPTRTETAGLLHAGQTLSVRASVHTHTPTPRKLTATPTRPGLPDENTSWEARGTGHTHGFAPPTAQRQDRGRRLRRGPQTRAAHASAPNRNAARKRDRNGGRTTGREISRSADPRCETRRISRRRKCQQELGAAQRQTSSEDGNDVDCAKQEQ